MRDDRQARLAAMREASVGAFAIATIVFALLIEYAALVALAPAQRRLGLIAGATVARWAMTIALSLFPYARPSGVGLAFKRGLGGSEVAIATLITSVVALGLGWRTLVPLALALVIVLLLGRASTRTLGGLTGDVYGAIGELVFVATLLCWTVAP
jgi:adenosylcobinamide-GDP ribazoletransferase